MSRIVNNLHRCKQIICIGVSCNFQMEAIDQAYVMAMEEGLLESVLDKVKPSITQMHVTIDSWLFQC